jgi:hypothetical protein
MPPTVAEVLGDNASLLNDKVRPGVGARGSPFFSLRAPPWLAMRRAPMLFSSHVFPSPCLPPLTHHTSQQEATLVQALLDCGQEHVFRDWPAAGERG